MSEYSELADALIDFEGLDWIPGVAKLLEGFAEINEAAHAGQLTVDATQTLLSLLGNPNGPDLNHLLALTAKTITGPTTTGPMPRRSTCATASSPARRRRPCCCWSTTPS
jgi:hypothetical protein